MVSVIFYFLGVGDMRGWMGERGEDGGKGREGRGGRWGGELMGEVGRGGVEIDENNGDGDGE